MLHITFLCMQSCVAVMCAQIWNELQGHTSKALIQERLSFAKHLANTGFGKLTGDSCQLSPCA